jgi:uroporphyrinogen-III synthase
VSALPLAGKTILVTRARRQAGKLAGALRAQGAAVVEIPAIEIVPPDSYAPIDAALAHLSRFQWLIVTSANTVAVVRERAAVLGVALAAFAPLRIAAIGSATAQALRDFGLEPAVMPPEYVAESLLDALGTQVTGQRVLLARAAIARDVIPDALRGRGAVVEVVDAYRTVIPADSIEEMRAVFGSGGHAPEAATFTSSSTVTNFLALLAAAGLRSSLPMKAISIGPVTSATLRENGWDPAAEADPHDLAGLVDAAIRALPQRS